jgi:hypothetical protein
MTPTEEQLTDALREIARTVREEALPPLPAPGLDRHVWRRRLTPLAAAAAVALIAVLALVLPGKAHKPEGGPTPGTALPRYFVLIQSYGLNGGGFRTQIEVHATGTGSLADLFTSPGNKWIAAGVAGAGGGRFIAEYTYSPLYGGTRGQSQTRLYSFRLTADGHVAGFSLVPGGVLTGYVPDQLNTFGSALAVSPDGSQVALAVDPAPPCPPGPNGCPTEIAVINLRTGQHELWGGGLSRSGTPPSITGISWASDSGPLVFLAQWCINLNVCGVLPRAVHIAQVRTLNLATRGGSLAQGDVLLGQSARYPEIVAARLVPGRAALAVVVLSSPVQGRDGFLRVTVQVMDIPLGGHGRPSLLYHQRQVASLQNVGLSPDASGRHWLLALSRDGWIGDPGDGRLHLLAPLNTRAGRDLLYAQAGYEAW